MLAFSTDELALRFRSDVADPLEGGTTAADSECLWSDYDVYGYLTAACDQLAKDTEAFYKVIQRPVVANEPLIVIPQQVHIIREARLVTARVYLEPYNIDDRVPSLIDDYGTYSSGNMTVFNTVGQPRSYIQDYEPQRLRLVPIPAMDDTLEFQAVVTIAVPQQAGMPLPFRDTEDQLLLLKYMKYLAYQKQDADTLDLARADKFKKEYDDGSVERKYEYRRRRRQGGLIRSDV